MSTATDSSSFLCSSSSPFHVPSSFFSSLSFLVPLALRQHVPQAGQQVPRSRLRDVPRDRERVVQEDELLPHLPADPTTPLGIPRRHRQADEVPLHLERQFLETCIMASTDEGKHIHERKGRA